MEKLLAALNLPQVGDIKVIPIAEDPEKKEGLFSLELNTRVYTLRAKSEAEAMLWVNTLNQIRQQELKKPTPTPNPINPNPKPVGGGGSGGGGSSGGKGGGADWDKKDRCFGLSRFCCCCRS